MKKIRVLEVIRQGQIGGGESHLLDLIDGFGPDVEPVVLSFTSGHMIDQLTAKGVKCKVLDTGKAFDLKVILSINRLIREERIELVHAHGSRAASNLLFSCYWLKIPLLYTVHGWSFHPDQSLLVQKLRGWSERRRQIIRSYMAAAEGTELTILSVEGEDHVGHLAVGLTAFRDEVVAKLATAGVCTAVHYPIPDHLQPAFAMELARVSLPVTEETAEIGRASCRERV